MVFSRFNLRHLRCFLTVVETQNISSAAELIHLSQPAVTLAIRKLEAIAGTPLLDRRPNGVFTNEAGELLHDRVIKAFDLLEEGITIIGRRAGNPEVRKTLHLITSTHLKTVIALRQIGSFALAARQLGIAQSSLHRTARHLEELIGLALFTASHKGVELTEPAAFLARFAMLAGAELRQGQDEINALKGQDTSRILVGSMPLSRTTILPQATHALLSNHEGVQVRNIDGPYMELLHMLRHGDLDFLIGALRDPPPTDDIVQEELFTDTLAVIARHDHPLSQQAELTVAQLRAYPWISPPPSTPAGQQTADFLGVDANTDGTPIRIISSSLVIVRGLLMCGDYLTLMSPRQLKVEIDTDLIISLPISPPLADRPIGLTFRGGWRPTRTQSLFLDLVRSFAL